MKKQIVPISNTITEGIKLPVVLYESGGSRITLKVLDKAEVEQVFGFQFTPKGENSFEYKDLRHTYRDPTLLSDLAASTLQVYIEADSDAEGGFLKDRVGFGLKLVLGRSDDYAAVWTEFNEDGAWGFLRLNATTMGARRHHQAIIRPKTIEDLQLAIQADESNNSKLPTLKALLNGALEQVRAIDVSCVLFFSLLESLYIQDTNPSEKTYKLTMRITKKLGEDFNFMVRLKGLYNKRSKVIHGGEKGNVFTQEEHTFLESLATESLLDFLVQPNNFSATYLDKLLLGENI